MSNRRDLELMHRDLMSEVFRLRIAQHALVGAGSIKSPDNEKIAKANRLERLANLLSDISTGDARIVRRDGDEGVAA